MRRRERQTPAGWLVLDTGALVALERRNAALRALLAASAEANIHFAVPVGVLAQAWRGGNEQALLGAFLKSQLVTVVPMDRELGLAAGVLCGRAGTRDVIDASVVLIARRLRAVVVSGDAGDMKKLDPNLNLVPIPTT